MVEMYIIKDFLLVYIKNYKFFLTAKIKKPETILCDRLLVEWLVSGYLPLFIMSFYQNYCYNDYRNSDNRNADTNNSN